MKKYKLLTLSLVALLASCGSKAAPTGYNTKVNLPSGGTEIKENKSARVVELVEGCGEAFDFNDIKFSDVTTIDAKVKVYQEDFAYDIKVSGKLTVSFYHTESVPNPEDPEGTTFVEGQDSEEVIPEAEPFYSSIVSIELSEFTVNVVTLYNGKKQGEMNIANASLGLHYVYEVNQAKPLILLDLSSPAIYNVIKDNLLPMISQFLPDQAEAIKGVLEKYLVTQGGKFFVGVEELNELIEILTTMGIEPTIDMSGAQIKVLPLVSYMFSGGDLVSSIIALIKNLLPSLMPQPVPTEGEEPAEGEEPVEPVDYSKAAEEILDQLTYVFKEYKSEESERYGLAFNLTEKDIIPLIPTTEEDQSEFIEEDPEGELNVFRAEEEEEEPLPFNIDDLKFNVGLAAMFGNTQGSEVIAPESIQLKAKASVKNMFDVQGEINSSLYFADQAVTLLDVSKIDEYSASLSDLIKEILELLPQPQGGEEDPIIEEI